MFDLFFLHIFGFWALSLHYFVHMVFGFVLSVFVTMANYVFNKVALNLENQPDYMYTLLSAKLVWMCPMSIISLMCYVM